MGYITSDYAYWDVGEVYGTRPPSLADKSLARILKALVLCYGRLHASHVDPHPDNTNYPPLKWGQYSVLYRISLPKGKEEQFEALSGYKLAEPPTIKGSFE